MLGTRTNFVGWTVHVSGDVDMVFPVVEAPATTCCDFCNEIVAAEYMVDAVTELGDGGNNVFYCQEHLRKAVEEYSKESGDVWRLPDGQRPLLVS
jgi:hypothetical protein